MESQISDKDCPIERLAIDEKSRKLLKRLGCYTLNTFLALDVKLVLQLKDSDWDMFFSLRKSQEKLKRQFTGGHEFKLTSESNSSGSFSSKSSASGRRNTFKSQPKGSNHLAQLTLDLDAPHCDIPLNSEPIQPISESNIRVDSDLSETNTTYPQASRSLENGVEQPESDPDKASEQQNYTFEDDGQALDNELTYQSYDQRELENPEVDETGIPVTLYSQTAVGWTPIPDWASFLVSVGTELGPLFAVHDKRCIIAVALPTRSFAGASVLVGIMAYLAKYKTDLDVDAHFELVRRLRPGSPLRIVHGTHWQTARFMGVDNSGDEPRVKVRISRLKGAVETRYFTKSSCLMLEPTERTTGRRRRKICKNTGFAAVMLDGVDLEDFSLRSALKCLVISGSLELRKELTTVPFAAGHGRKIHQGFLQDLVRVREFLPPGYAYHSSVLGLRSDKVKEVSTSASPRFVIFDGASTFIKWRAGFPKSHAIVLLDRTGPHLDEACSIISTSYFQRLNNSDIPSFPNAPKGIELIAFWE